MLRSKKKIENRKKMDVTHDVYISTIQNNRKATRTEAITVVTMNLSNYNEFSKNM